MDMTGAMSMMESYFPSDLVIDHCIHIYYSRLGVLLADIDFHNRQAGPTMGA